jgi:hypothetical protein
MRSIPCPLTIRQGVIRHEEFSTTSTYVLLGETTCPVSHAACAVKLETSILVDAFTFLRPPTPSERLFVLLAPDAVPSGRPF